MTPRHYFDALEGHDPAASALWMGQARLGMGALLRAVEQARRRLRGVRVLAVLADNGPAWVCADLAALQAGVVHLPLPAFFSDAQLRHALVVAGADAIWTDQAARILALDLDFAVDDESEGLSCLRRSCAPSPLPAGTAKISFTSGSTGTPKGACLEARGLLAAAAAVCDAMNRVQLGKHLAVLPLALLLENVAGIYAPLLRGAAVELRPLQQLGWRGMAGFDPAALQLAAHGSGANSAILVPELLKAWTLYLQATGTRAPQSLAYLAVGGAQVAQPLLEHARALGLPAYQGYGLTECGSVVSLNRPGDDGPGVGRPLHHLRVGVDADEIVIDGAPLLGYIGSESPAPGTSPLRTGDLGRIDADGHLHLDGRRSNLLVTSYGRNIAPEWVESVLLSQPEIAQAVVFGDARASLCALLVPYPNRRLTDLGLALSRANGALPDYARIHAWIPVPPFSPDNGLATGNGRPRRQHIHRHYADAISALYDN
ncbi:MAG: long-chain fatty acid--CoA ligase [Proteobacteria bacterium]|nr:long-chain fatty acid--CoA ligase [Pseudomonadota bacterium]